MLTHSQRLESKIKVNEMLQRRVNYMWDFYDDSSICVHCYVTKQLILSIAESALAEFPQYQNKWDDYELISVDDKIDTKGGLAFMPGDVTVGRIEYRNEPGVDGKTRIWCAYSIRRQIDVTLPMNTKIEQLQ